MKLRYLLVIVIAGSIVVLMSAIFFNTGPGKGDPAPNFHLQDASGKNISLNQLEGEVVLLHFWATWCDLCLYELVSVEHLHKEFKQKGLNVISVLEDADSLPNLKVKIKQFSNISFPVLFDPDGQAARKYGVYGVPESFIISKKGIVLERLQGGVDWDALPYIVYFDKLLQQ